MTPPRRDPALGVILIDDADGAVSASPLLESGLRWGACSARLWRCSHRCGVWGDPLLYHYLGGIAVAIALSLLWLSPMFGTTPSRLGAAFGDRTRGEREARGCSLFVGSFS